MARLGPLKETIYILETHFSPKELDELTLKLRELECTVTFDVKDATLVLTKLTARKRIERDLGDVSVGGGFAQGILPVLKADWVTESWAKGKWLDNSKTPWLLFQIRTRDMEAKSSPPSKKARLKRHATSIVADKSEDESDDLEMPRRMATLACQRRTPLVGKNQDFVELLLEVRLARELALDSIGVRAYSSTISAIRACDIVLTSEKQLRKIPGCGKKIVAEFKQFIEIGTIDEVEALKESSEFQTLKLFWNVWGVGARTARTWYFQHGWRTLDDVIKGGWEQLPRVQQIGLKYYDEFLGQINRDEVEEIGRVVAAAGNKVLPGVQSCICGGFRRGKPKSNDVDIVLSHYDEMSTKNLLVDIIKELERSSHISHTLTLMTPSAHHPTDTPRYHFSHDNESSFGAALDTGLVVFIFPKGSKYYTGIHRRLDIIISPWKSFGTAIVGWTGGTTFERDLRRHAEKAKGMKFDSSAVTHRRTGEIIDTWSDLKANVSHEILERKVFEVLELDWIEPTLRNTL